MTAAEDRREASLSDVWRALAEMPDPFVICRGWGHAWNPPRSYDRKRTDSGFAYLEKTVPCIRCGTERFDRLIRRDDRWVEPDDQQVFGARYDYAEGFLMDPGYYVSRIETREYVGNRDAPVT